MKFQIKYKTLMMSVIIIFSVIFIIDRFTYNVWPLYFTKSSPIEEDWTASTFFIIGWICGRELIVASSFIWLLQCRCLWNWVFEHKPKWLLVDDIMIENNHMHYHLGWAAIALPMVVHTWLVFLPLVQGNPITVHKTFYRPIDHSLEPDFFLETYHHHHVHVSINDVLALAILTITFLGLFPLSMNKKIRKKHWSVAQYLHQFAALLYAIELLRTPLTAHCWFICTPFILLYICDRLLATFYYRFTDKAKVVCQCNFDDKYVLLCLWIPDLYYHVLQNPTGIAREIGDVFWLNTKGFALRKIPQAAHPFTSFYNHNNVIPNIFEFFKPEEIRKDLGHPGNKFRFVKKRAQDEEVQVDDIIHERNISYQLNRTETVDPEIVKQQNMKMAASPTSDHNNSIPEDAEDDEDYDGIVSDDKISTKPKIKQLRNTDSVFIHNNHVELSKLHEQNTLERKETLKSWQWNVGFIMRVHKRETNSTYGFTERIAQRKAIKDTEEENCMMSYGPYRSSFANIIEYLIPKEDITTDYDYDGAVIFIATGAGASYMIETMLYLRGRFNDDPNLKLKRKVRIQFSCRSIPLFQWVTNFLCEKKLPGVEIYANLTSHPNITGYQQDPVDVEFNKEELFKKKKASFAEVGRAAFKQVLKNSPHGSKVFFLWTPSNTSKN